VEKEIEHPKPKAGRHSKKKQKNSRPNLSNELHRAQKGEEAVEREYYCWTSSIKKVKRRKEKGTVGRKERSEGTSSKRHCKGIPKE